MNFGSSKLDVFSSNAAVIITVPITIKVYFLLTIQTLNHGQEVVVRTATQVGMQILLLAEMKQTSCKKSPMQPALAIWIVFNSL